MSWNPYDTFSHFLTEYEDLKDNDIVKHYIEYNGFDGDVYEIWKYMSDNYKIYPSKITSLGIVYSFNINIFMEIMFDDYKKPEHYSVFNRNGNLTQGGNLIPIIYNEMFTFISLHKEVEKRIKKQKKW